jgi:hypothetical protein
MVATGIFKRPIYKVGGVVFALENCDETFEQKVDSLLPRYQDADFNEDLVVEIDTVCAKNIDELLAHVVERNFRCAWINAACLVSPEGKTVLIAGPPLCGKTTLAMALALGHQWKVLNAEVVILDPDSSRILKVAMPFQVGEGTPERLRDAIGIMPEPLVDNKWYPLGDAASDDDREARIDLAILIERWTPRMKVDTITRSEYLRKLLYLSNLLRREDSFNVATEMLNSAQCLVFRGGTLTERVNEVLEKIEVEN